MDLQARQKELEDALLQILANYNQVAGRVEEIKYLIQQEAAQKLVDEGELVEAPHE